MQCAEAWGEAAADAEATPPERRKPTRRDAAGSPGSCTPPPLSLSHTHTRMSKPMRGQDGSQTNPRGRRRPRQPRRPPPVLWWRLMPCGRGRGARQRYQGRGTLAERTLDAARRQRRRGHRERRKIDGGGGGPPPRKRWRPWAPSRRESCEREGKPREQMQANLDCVQVRPLLRKLN